MNETTNNTEMEYDEYAYDTMGTAELRKLIRERGLASGLAVSAANKETCIALLQGKISSLGAPAAAGTATASNCQQSSAMPTSDATVQLANALKAFIPSGIDEKQVIELASNTAEAVASATLIDKLSEVDARIQEVKGLIAPLRVVVENRATGETRDMGITHRAMPTLLAMCQARLADGYAPNIYLYGPAGTGKTTAAKQVAKALGLEYYFNGAIDCEYKLSGFIDASGTFRSRPFYEAYSQGGVYLFDELDSSMPGAVMAFNSALANGYADFPVGRVERHRDCIILAAGNTDLRGAKDGYGARSKMDAAFRDRFTFLSWDIDEALENAIADSYGDNHGWLELVRRCRRNAKAAGIRDFEVTPRAVGNGLAMLNAGVSMQLTTECVLRKGLSNELWAKVIK